MNDDVVISVENVSKVYNLYDRPQDRLKQALLWRFGKTYSREFWALRDVSFEVKRGETVGIIGRNGSGKSTLLQIIAGTLQPTTGSVTVKGRVAALLELGSGFNSEFTGRENVYMAGSLLGLNEQQVTACFDEIAAFADIGSFIEQPVKLYSSGMFLRLAFAVQAILPKDILIVDEALAVGDASFQRKCYQKLENFREGGGTVLLVTHDVQTVVRQAQAALMLVGGEVLALGQAKPVCEVYQQILFSGAVKSDALVGKLRKVGWHKFEQQQDFDSDGESQAVVSPTQQVAHHYGNGDATILEYALYDAETDQKVDFMYVGKWYVWRERVLFHKISKQVRFAMQVVDKSGLSISHFSTVDHVQQVGDVDANQFINVEFKFRANILPGTYFFNFGVNASARDDRVSLDRYVEAYKVAVVYSMDAHNINHGIVYMDSQITFSTE